MDSEHEPEHDHTEANLAAVAMVREALKNAHGIPNELPYSTVDGYLERCWQQLGSPEDGMDATVPLMELLKSLAQLAGAAMVQAATGPGMDPPPIGEILDRLDVLQQNLMEDDKNE